MNFNYHQFVSVFYYIPELDDVFNERVPKEVADAVDRWKIYFDLSAIKVSEAISKVLSEEDLMD